MQCVDTGADTCGGRTVQANRRDADVAPIPQRSCFGKRCSLPRRRWLSRNSPKTIKTKEPHAFDRGARGVWRDRQSELMQHSRGEPNKRSVWVHGRTIRDPRTGNMVEVYVCKVVTDKPHQRADVV